MVIDFLVGTVGMPKVNKRGGEEEAILNNKEIEVTKMKDLYRMFLNQDLETKIMLTTEKIWTTLAS